MFKLLPTYAHSPYILDICTYLIHYRGLIFSENQNPVSVFLNQLEQNKIEVISAVKNDKFIGFVVLYDFHEVSKNKFFCYMYGAVKRHCANDVDKGFNAIFASLASQGCVAVRVETRKFNMPMRVLANRLGFKKIGILSKCAYNNGKFEDNILYEKILLL